MSGCVAGWCSGQTNPSDFKPTNRWIILNLRADCASACCREWATKAECPLPDLWTITAGNGAAPDVAVTTRRGLPYGIRFDAFDNDK